MTNRILLSSAHFIKSTCNYNFKVCLNNKPLKYENHVIYLGISISSHLNWKEYIKKNLAKFSRGIGILTKIRHYVNSSILVQLYYSLIYPFLTYEVLAWGDTYKTNLQKIITSQKRAIRIITFSGINDHWSPLIKKLSILKFFDLVQFYIALFAFDYHTNKLPPIFNHYFIPISTIHHYNNRLASKSSYSLPKIKTNYGKFSSKFQSAFIWNKTPDNFKSLNRNSFKKKLKINYTANYWQYLLYIISVLKENYTLLTLCRTLFLYLFYVIFYLFY